MHRGVRGKLADAAARARTLESEADRQRPDVEARMVALYKMGRAGYWRLLLDVDSLRDMGRAYRTAAALDRIDRERDRSAPADARGARKPSGRRSQARAAELQDLEKKAQRAARAAIDAAVAARNALVARSISARDLNAQLAGELQEAQRRLQATVAQLAAGAAAGPPCRCGRSVGASPGPPTGVVLARFGAQAIGGAASSRSGIELSLRRGQPVHAVHEGDRRLCRAVHRVRQSRHRGPRRQRLLALRPPRDAWPSEAASGSARATRRAWRDGTRPATRPCTSSCASTASRSTLTMAEEAVADPMTLRTRLSVLLDLHAGAGIRRSSAASLASRGASGRTAPTSISGCSRTWSRWCSTTTSRK